MSVLAVDSWTVAARRLGTPEYTKAHRTVINHFLKFYSQLVVVLPNLPKSLPKYPSQHVLSSFVGYLACQPSLGGTTLRGYMARLPTETDDGQSGVAYPAGQSGPEGCCVASRAGRSDAGSTS